MIHQLAILVGGILFVLIGLYVNVLLIGGVGMQSLVRLGAALAPIGALALIAARRYWLPLLICGWIVSLRLPVEPLDAVTVGFMIMAAVGLVYIVERTITRKALWKLDHWATALLFVAGVIVLTRFALDRPGSARMGGMGGLRNALAYTAAIPLFFIADQLARERFKSSVVFITVYAVALLMLGWSIVQRLLQPAGMPFYFGWYAGAMWFLLPMTLASLIRRMRRLEGWMPVVAVFCVLYLLMAILSPFRSRIYFAVGGIAAVFWCFGYRHRLVMGGVAAVLAALSLVAFVPRESIPVQARRALSTILPYDQFDARAMQYEGIRASSEMGWQSDFRRTLAEMALMHIREKPWLGQGWKFSAAEIEWAGTFAGSNWGASSLVTAGDYHNSIMTIAVKCGLPAAILLSIALLALFARSMLWSNRLDSDSDRTLYAAMAGATIALVGQMLMNGGGQDLQAVCVMLGFFHGMRKRQEQSNADQE